MYRFLGSPRWLAGHALVLVAVVTFTSLGMWQLGRLEDRRAHNTLLAERMGQEEVELAALDPSDPQALAYLPVTITGAFDTDAEVLLSTRSHGGRPGHHVLTPLRSAEGLTVLIDRGWVPLDWNTPPVRQAAPPAGEVQVRGLLHPSAEARRWGAFDGGDGPLQFVSDVDVPVLSEAIGTSLYPLYLVALEQSPPQRGEIPTPAEPPELTEGSHLSYAAQWFIFALVVAIGYPILLWRTAGDQRRPPPAVRQPDPEPTPVP
jgi:surfeit locus 1 family protein